MKCDADLCNYNKKRECTLNENEIIIDSFAMCLGYTPIRLDEEFLETQKKQHLEVINKRREDENIMN